MKDAKTDSEKAFIKADNATEDSEKELAQILEEIYNLLDKQNDVQLDPITVNFGPIPNKYDKAEYFSQLKGQEEGINALSVHDWLTNRATYTASGRASSGDAAQAEYRDKVIAVLRKLKLSEDPNITPGEAETWAKDYMESQAALHDPDQVAGGDPKGIAKGKCDSMLGLGSIRINSSIGGRWSTRVGILQTGVENQVKTKKITKEQQKTTKMKSVLKM